MAGSDFDVYSRPINPTVLYLQTQHHSDSIYSEEEMGPLHCRHRGFTMMCAWRPHQRIVEYLHVADFYGVFRVCNIQFDWALITVMVER